MVRLLRIEELPSWSSSTVWYFSLRIWEPWHGSATKALTAISIIGGADGPSFIFLAGKLQQTAILGPIAVAAYSYMSLVPIIQPPIMKLLTTEKNEKLKWK